MTVKENLDRLQNYLISHKVKGTNRSLINIEECVEIIKSIHSIIPNSLDESEIIVRQKESIIEQFHNDYNVKFLPYTQFEELSFSRKKVCKSMYWNIKNNII